MNASTNGIETSPDWLGIVLKQVESLRFGAVQITVHDSRVVQIEKTEKVHLDQEGRRAVPPQ